VADAAATLPSDAGADADADADADAEPTKEDDDEEEEDAEADAETGVNNGASAILLTRAVAAAEVLGDGGCDWSSGGETLC
jgi:hypothetical protein